MHIGVVLSGYEQLPLFTILHKFDCTYEIFVDRKYWPRPEKSQDLVSERIEYGIKYLIETVGVDYCIVPALSELSYLGQENYPYKDKILPLYTNYLQEICFAQSLVGKIGLLTTPSAYKNVQFVIEQEATNYKLSNKQQATKSFNNPFSYWTKSVRMRSYYITSFSKKDWMVRKSIKNDMRYFHDAGVDTVIPTSWMFLYYEKILTHQLNARKIKFHGIASIETILSKILNTTNSAYGVTIHTTDSGIPWVEERKWRSLLTRGGLINLIIKVV